MDLDDVLNEKVENKPAEPKPEQNTETQKESAPQVETVASSRAKHQEKEQAAQDEGRKRNPDGTFAPAEPNEELKAEVKTDPKEPAKEPTKEQPKIELTAKERAFLA